MNPEAEREKLQVLRIRDLFQAIYKNVYAIYFFCIFAVSLCRP